MIDNNKRKRRSKAITGASSGIAVAILVHVNSWSKAMMKTTKGQATLNNSTIRYTKNTSRILSMLTGFRAARPFSLEVLENTVITHQNPSGRKCHFSTTKIIKLIKEKEVSTK